MIKLSMRNIFNRVLILLLFCQVVHAQDATTNLPLADLSKYVAKLEKADAYDVRKLYIKKDPSFKNGIVLLNVNCGQGLCTNYVFAKNKTGNFDFAGTVDGIFEESNSSTATPDYPELLTQTKSAPETVMIKWAFNTKKQAYEVK